MNRAFGRRRAAITYYQRLADQHPNSAEYSFQLGSSQTRLGDLLSGLGKQAEAEILYRAAIKIYQRLADEHTNHSVPRRYLAPRDNNLPWQLATCPGLKLRDPKQAVTLAKRAVELAPGNGLYWNILGVAQYRNGDWKAAVEALLKSIQFRNGGDSFDFFFLAMAHWQLDEKEKARAWFEKAVAWMDKHEPNDEELKRFRAEATVLLGLAKAASTKKKKE